MAFEVEFRNATFMKKLVEVCKEIVANNRIVMEFSPSEGVYIQAVDTSRVCLLVVKMPTETFSRYSVERMVRICLDVTKLQKALKFGDMEAPVAMQTSERGDSVVIKGVSHKNADATFTFPLLHVTEEDEMHFELPDRPDPDAFVARYNALNFGRLIRELSNFGDTVQFETSEGELQVSVSNSDGMEARARVIHEAMVQDTGLAQSASFGIAYLGSLFKSSTGSLAQWVQVEIADDRPAVFHFDLEYDGVLRMFLAPRIRDADDDHDS